MALRRASRSGFDTWQLSSSSAEAEVCPARGALVTRFAIGGDEVLYLDEATFADGTKNVRGGVPLLFPVAGPPPAGSKLQQHGFARKLPWSAEAAGEAVRLTLESNDQTRDAWPYEFRLEYTVELVDTRLELRWLVHNRDEKPMPLHFGLHPYFRVPVETKAKARVETQATRAWDNRKKAFGPVPALDFSGEELDVHLLDHAAKGTVLHRGDGTQVPLQWSQGLDTLVLWTLPGQPFICVEPWSGPSYPALEGERPVLAPGGTAGFAFLVGGV
jgi:galactose mutarotase-like enzyme